MGISRKVCVIGAGPSGLVAARELNKEGHTVVVLEQSHDIGGQWLYEPNVEREDPLGRTKFLEVHSSIYASLRTAVPREVMGFMDFPFKVKKGRDMRRFPGHREVWLYLKDFCDYFGLYEMIRFNMRVEYVGMLNFGGNGMDLKWVVKSQKRNSCEKVVEEIFDAVVVASGEFSHPRLPTIRGMEKWKGKQIHSHAYRIPDPFRNEVVVIVGNSISGRDISMELLGVAKSIHLSSKSLDATEGLSKVISKHGNFHFHPQIDHFEEGRILFVDGSWVIADTIIFCTGYSYAFPFLDTKGMLVVDDDRVAPLFEHTFPPLLAPFLSFIGIPRKIIAFYFFETQAKWISQVLSGKTTLPSPENMMESARQFYQSTDVAGIPKHKTHDIADFEYCNKYADQSGSPHAEEWRKKILLLSIANSDANLMTYRDSWHDHELLQEAYQSTHFMLHPEKSSS